MNIFQNKSKVVFEVELIVRDMENLPYISGLYYVKWSLRKSTRSGFTQKETTVEWNSRIFIPETSLKIGKDGILQPSYLDLFFRQDRGEKTNRWDDLGTVTINLAEFADARSSEKRYLLQESKLNTFTTIIINIRLISGDPNYKVPEAERELDPLLSDAPGILHRGMSITQLMTRDQQADSPDFVKAEVIQERRNDEAAIDEIFLKARTK